MNTVAPNLLSVVIYASNAHKVWEDLRERFDKVNAAISFYLHKEIAKLTQKLLTVSQYFSKLRELWDEYEALDPPPSCGCLESKQHAEHYQLQKLYQFLTGLNDSFDNAKDQILMIRPLPNVNQTYAMVVNVESQIRNNTALSVGIGDSAALMSKANSRNGNSSIKPRNSLGRPTLQCDYCHLKGHTKDTCYKLHGYPANFKAKKRGYSGPQVNNAFTARGFQPSDLPQPTPQPTPQFFSPDPVFTQEQYDQILHMLNKVKQVELVANAATMNNTCTIKAFMSHLVNGNWIVDTGASNHMVHNSKLLSEIKDLTSIDHNKVHLPNSEQIAISHTGASRIFKTKSLQNDLLSRKPDIPEDSVQLQNAKQSTNLASSVNTSSSSSNNKAVHAKSTENCIVYLWNKRLGHAPLKVLQNISCSTLPFELVHADVWGPYRVPTNDVLTQFDNKVKCLRSDNGTEFFNEKGASPFEKLYNKVPSLQHLRVFGSLCYATSTSKADKFSPRVVPTVHLGYYSVRKGYILYGLHSKLFFADCSSLQCIHPRRTPRIESPSSGSSQSVDPTHLVSDLHPQSSPSPIPPPIRKSSRTSVPPIWLKDYVVPSKGAVCNYSISLYVCYDKLSPAYQACIAAYSVVSEPTSYVEASTDPKWIEAMQAEIAALEENQTWSIVDVPPGKAPIGCKWVFKVKTNPLGGGKV
ncbi:PREDICTED: uncharacterized protein LOC109238959 [Nicotiana attenuata]|uniref:uncharacterized protein LOC109238959 n=1 Tax=Nicotiana attenuata TaxID=49451 RepID=UPI000904E3BA|nr:PREDICTED: uncharacterized protein LOC109238959 [Nicotiana attenuata]